MRQYGSRIIAFLLAAGGALGIAVSVAMCVQMVQQHHNARLFWSAPSVVLFAASVLAGWGLWRSTPLGLKWAKILWTLQVPVFTVGRFSYEFSTLLSLRVMIGDTTHRIGANVGSSSNVYLWPQSPGFLLGINLVAVLALLYLLVAARPARTSPAPLVIDPTAVRA